MKNFYLIILILLMYSSLNAQVNNSDSTKNNIPPKQKFFGNIYTSFNYGLNENITPRQSFDLTTALLGYQAEINDKVKATLIYDVTKTTGDIQVKDSIGRPMSVSFFKGSDYTAFLKQAQIDWHFAKDFELSVGQLLNQQYLTFQDKFWGYRYITFTFQERYKFGSQADFGARLTWYKKDLVNLSIGTVNGDGAFYKQDAKGLLLYHLNAELIPIKNVTVKFYFDISPDQNKPARMVYSSFLGYKSDKFRIAIEYNYISHPDYISNKSYSGYSFYSSFKINEKIEVLARFDFIENSIYYKDSQYIIAGIQYQPAKNFFISLNGRDLIPEDQPQIYINFGLKF